MDLDSPFDTELIYVPGMNAQELEYECNQLLARQKAIQMFLDGEVGLDYLGDFLDFQRIDPVEYAITVEENLLYLGF